MEIAAMINELKLNAAQTEKEVSTLEILVTDLRDRLSAAENDLRKHQDDLTALRMAIESLEIVGAARTTPATPPAQKAAAAKFHHSRAPKKIIKLNASGKEIGVFGSISKCATALGWSFPATKKYIEQTKPEKQIYLRGYILKYAG